MKTILFGGNHCQSSIQNYLFSMIRAIGIQIELGLKLKKDHRQIKKEVIELFTIEKFKFHLSSAEVVDNGSNRMQDLNKNGKTQKVMIKLYKYLIQFDGDTNILRYRPENFHGHNCNAEIIVSADNKKTIKVIFESAQNVQELFFLNKSLSIGSLVANGNEANTEIEKWNNNLIYEFDNLYPKVKAEFEKKIEFNRKNNIKTIVGILG